MSARNRHRLYVDIRLLDPFLSRASHRFVLFWGPENLKAGQQMYPMTAALGQRQLGESYTLGARDHRYFVGISHAVESFRDEVNDDAMIRRAVANARFAALRHRVRDKRWSPVFVLGGTPRDPSPLRWDGKHQVLRLAGAAVIQPGDGPSYRSPTSITHLELRTESGRTAYMGFADLLEQIDLGMAARFDASWDLRSANPSSDAIQTAAFEAFLRTPDGRRHLYVEPKGEFPELQMFRPSEIWGRVIQETRAITIRVRTETGGSGDECVVRSSHRLKTADVISALRHGRLVDVGVLSDYYKMGRERLLIRHAGASAAAARYRVGAGVVPLFLASRSQDLTEDRLLVWAVRRPQRGTWEVLQYEVDQTGARLLQRSEPSEDLHGLLGSLVGKFVLVPVESAIIEPASGRLQLDSAKYESLKRSARAQSLIAGSPKARPLFMSARRDPADALVRYLVQVQATANAEDMWRVLTYRVQGRSGTLLSAVNVSAAEVHRMFVDDALIPLENYFVRAQPGTAKTDVTDDGTPQQVEAKPRPRSGAEPLAARILREQAEVAGLAGEVWSRTFTGAGLEEVEQFVRMRPSGDGQFELELLDVAGSENDGYHARPTGRVIEVLSATALNEALGRSLVVVRPAPRFDPEIEAFHLGRRNVVSPNRRVVAWLADRPAERRVFELTAQSTNADDGMRYVRALHIVGKGIHYFDFSFSRAGELRSIGTGQLLADEIVRLFRNGQMRVPHESLASRIGDDWLVRVPGRLIDPDANGGDRRYFAIKEDPSDQLAFLDRGVLVAVEQDGQVQYVRIEGRIVTVDSVKSDVLSLEDARALGLAIEVQVDRMQSELGSSLNSAEAAKRLGESARVALMLSAVSALGVDEVLEVSSSSRSRSLLGVEDGQVRVARTDGTRALVDPLRMLRELVAEQDALAVDQSTVDPVPGPADAVAAPAQSTPSTRAGHRWHRVPLEQGVMQAIQAVEQASLSSVGTRANLRVRSSEPPNDGREVEESRTHGLFAAELRYLSSAGLPVILRGSTINRIFSSEGNLIDTQRRSAAFQVLDLDAPVAALALLALVRRQILVGPQLSDSSFEELEWVNHQIVALVNTGFRGHRLSKAKVWPVVAALDAVLGLTDSNGNTDAPAIRAVLPSLMKGNLDQAVRLLVAASPGGGGASLLDLQHVDHGIRHYLAVTHPELGIDDPLGVIGAGSRPEQGSVGEAPASPERAWESLLEPADQARLADRLALSLQTIAQHLGDQEGLERAREIAGAASTHREPTDSGDVGARLSALVALGDSLTQLMESVDSRVVEDLALAATEPGPLASALGALRDVGERVEQRTGLAIVEVADLSGLDGRNDNMGAQLEELRSRVEEQQSGIQGIALHNANLQADRIVNTVAALASIRDGSKTGQLVASAIAAVPKTVETKPFLDAVSVPRHEAEQAVQIPAGSRLELASVPPPSVFDLTSIARRVAHDPPEDRPREPASPIAKTIDKVELARFRLFVTDLAGAGEALTSSAQAIETLHRTDPTAFPQPEVDALARALHIVHEAVPVGSEVIAALADDMRRRGMGPDQSVPERHLIEQLQPQPATVHTPDEPGAPWAESHPSSFENDAERPPASPAEDSHGMRTSTPPSPDAFDL